MASHELRQALPDFSRALSWFMGVPLQRCRFHHSVPLREKSGLPVAAMTEPPDRRMITLTKPAISIFPQPSAWDDPRAEGAVMTLVFTRRDADQFLQRPYAATDREIFVHLMLSLRRS